MCVALLRLLAVYLGLFDHKRLGTNLYNKAPDQVTELHGRVFAVWTLLTCALSLICAKNPRVAAIYGATLFSFAVALLHFALELVFFQTMTLLSALQPMVVAAVSCLWMGAGWNYYTNLASEPEFSEPEAESVKQE